MIYKTVFEVTDKGLDFIFVMPIILLVIGSGLLWAIFKKYNGRDSDVLKLFGFTFTGFALSMVIFSIPSELSTRIKTKKAFHNKNYEIIEGEIEDFHPMPYEGHDHESFTVKGVYFEYSDNSIIYGFNNTASHGGPIRWNGQQVRLSYIQKGDDNIIIKVELRE